MYARMDWWVDGWMCSFSKIMTAGRGLHCWRSQAKLVHMKYYTVLVIEKIWPTVDKSAEICTSDREVNVMFCFWETDLTVE